MTKPASRRLHTVLKLARLREQAAAVKLAETIRNAEASIRQQQQLAHYKAEYTQQFQQQGKVPKSAASLANMQHFFASLEQAADTQQQRCVLADNQLSEAKAQWQALHAREKNMQSLLEKKQRQEERQREQKIQRQLDDAYRPVLPIAER